MSDESDGGAGGLGVATRDGGPLERRGVVGEGILGLGSRILATAERVRRASPGAVPVAFWDLDGTLLEGDCVDGYWREDGAGYPGLVERAILEGLCPAYESASGVAACERDFRETMRRDGRAVAYAFQSLIFAGGDQELLGSVGRRAFDCDLGGWFFAEALGLWRELEAGGVRCCLLSASPEFFVKSAASRLGVSPAQCAGMRLRVEPDGRLSGDLVGPPMFGDGKVRRMREWLAELDGAGDGAVHVPVAAFGNDRDSDGPMIEAVRRTPLPGGRALGIYVNLRDPRPEVDGDCVRFQPRGGLG